jgi:hypothetical protein
MVDEQVHISVPSLSVVRVDDLVDDSLVFDIEDLTVPLRIVEPALEVANLLICCLRVLKRLLGFFDLC